MITISVWYGKQTIVSEDRGRQQSAPADATAGDANDTEVLLNDIEQPKHLLVYDLGLRDSDQDWHSPLLTAATFRCMKNMRIRSQQTEQRRRETWARKNLGYYEARQERRDVRAESRDSLGP